MALFDSNLFIVMRMDREDYEKNMSDYENTWWLHRLLRSCCVHCPPLQKFLGRMVSWLGTEMLVVVEELTKVVIQLIIGSLMIARFIPYW